MIKNPPAIQETWVWALGWVDPLEEAMATNSSILARRSPMDRGAWWAVGFWVAKSGTHRATAQHDHSKQPHASPPRSKGAESALTEGKRKFSRLWFGKNPRLFIGWVLAGERRRILPAVLCQVCGPWERPCWSPKSIKLRFLYINYWLRIHVLPQLSRNQHT